MKLSDRVLAAHESQTIGLSRLISEMKAGGENIIGLNVGEPDFPPPPEVKKAIIDSLNQNHTRYGLTNGEKKVRELIVQKVKRDNQITCTPEEISLSNGSKHSLYALFQTLINP